MGTWVETLRGFTQVELPFAEKQRRPRHPSSSPIFRGGHKVDEKESTRFWTGPKRSAKRSRLLFMAHRRAMVGACSHGPIIPFIPSGRNSTWSTEMLISECEVMHGYWWNTDYHPVAHDGCASDPRAVPLLSDNVKGVGNARTWPRRDSLKSAAIRDWSVRI